MSRVALIPLLIAASACGGAMRAYPRWYLTGGDQLDHGCLLGRAMVRKSGKSGVGMTVELRSRTDCAVRISRAELVLDGERAPAELPETITLHGRTLGYLWLAFGFDNNRAWNDGRRTGTFEIELDVAGQPVTWRIDGQHRLDQRWKPDPGRRGWR